MSVRLVILGLLREKSLYGYEIKQLIEQRMDDWTSIAFGSIYFALEKLTTEKFVEMVGTEQDGVRPSRNVYSVTEKGQNEFIRLLKKVWSDNDTRKYPFDIGLFFMDSLEPDERTDFLCQRLSYLEKTIEYLKKHKKELAVYKEIPKQAIWIIEHSEFHLEAEYNWIRKLYAENM